LIPWALTSTLLKLIYSDWKNGLTIKMRNPSINGRMNRYPEIAFLFRSPVYFFP
jgi:hypothetical protein